MALFSLEYGSVGGRFQFQVLSTSLAGSPTQLDSTAARFIRWRQGRLMSLCYLVAFGGTSISHDVPTAAAAAAAAAAAVDNDDATNLFRILDQQSIVLRSE
jgi:hypothetical protein